MQTPDVCYNSIGFAGFRAVLEEPVFRCLISVPFVYAVLGVLTALLRSKEMKRELTLILIAFLFSGSFCLAACPSADLTGDCVVDFNDFALMAGQWLSSGIVDEVKMMWVAINDPGVDGHEAFIGEMSKYETTNAQYCEFLNAGLASGDITVDGTSVKGANGSNIGADFVGEVYYDRA
jgi:hypothetical protein